MEGSILVGRRKRSGETKTTLKTDAKETNPDERVSRKISCV